MKNIYVLLILGCASLMLFSSMAVAGDYDYEGTDEASDVENSNLDLIYAKTEEKDDNIDFSLQVSGNIVDDVNSYYIFTIEDLASSKSNTITYRFGFALLNGFININSVINNDILNVTVSKDEINVTTPWTVTVQTKLGGEIVDTLVLKIPNGDSKGDDDGNGDDDSGDSAEDKKGTPGFEFAILIMASFVIMLILRRRKY